MDLVIITGRSGSGKSVAIKALEDLGFYCVDNLPINLVFHLIQDLKNNYDRIAVGIDARNLPKDIAYLKNILSQINQDLTSLHIIYLDADEKTLLQRFSETRRRHPLTHVHYSLLEAIKKEHVLLSPIAALADLSIDTSQLTTHQLRILLRDRLAKNEPTQLNILIQSFGFKHGLPPDADFIFDCRFLPNPYWDSQLRQLTGLDQPVTDFLQSQQTVQQYLQDMVEFLNRWIPLFQAENRSYLTICCGCTGGIHRSVYLAKKLSEILKDHFDNVQLRHRELLKINASSAQEQKNWNYPNF